MAWYVWLLVGIFLGAGALGLFAWLRVKKLDAQENPTDDFIKRVRDLVTEAESLEASGEFKRHTVLARLQKEFPEKEERDLGLAIELAVRSVL